MTGNLIDDLRQAIIDSDMSTFQIAKDIEFDQPALCRFVNGKTGISLQVASRLAANLGLSLQPRKQKNAKSNTR